MKTNICLLFSVIFFSVTDAIAQTDEIIVTGSRIRGYAEDFIPVTVLKRRPDFMVVEAYIESDSRDRNLRLQEVRKTIDSLETRAGRARNIELGLLKTFETDQPALALSGSNNIERHCLRRSPSTMPPLPLPLALIMRSKLRDLKDLCAGASLGHWNLRYIFPTPAQQY